MRKFPAIACAALFLLTTSCEEILLEQDITSSSVELLAPAENAVLENSGVNFHWTPVTGATGYMLQIATPSFDMAQQIVTDVVVEETTYSEELAMKKYEWRVKAINSGYTTEFSSSKFEVKDVEEFSARLVNLLSPVDNHIANNRNIDLNWANIEGAGIYRLQVLQENQVVLEQTSLENNLRVQFPEGESIWRVRAENDTQSTLYSERNILVDVTAPNSPVLIKPNNEAELLSPSVNFEWERESISGSNEIDSLFIFKNATLDDPVLKEQVNTSYNTTLERGEIYYWFMKSYDSAGNIGVASSVFSFTIN